MTKVTLDIKDFKALASESRLDILKALDGKNMSLQDISTVTQLHEVTIHEHLTKLVEAGFVKKQEREGHKWVYYRLSWKGSSLLHPENTKVVVLFTSTFFTFCVGLYSFIVFFKDNLVPTAGGADGPLLGFGEPTFFSQILTTEIIVSVASICFILFVILLSVSVWRYRKNKPQKL